MTILNWNVYEITTEIVLINGVMLRGRLRKLGLENEVDILTENASDKENCVRFALLDNKDLPIFSEYITSIIPDSKIDLVLENVKNPVLSKLKVNIEDRYSL